MAGVEGRSSYKDTEGLLEGEPPPGAPTRPQESRGRPDPSLQSAFLAASVTAPFIVQYFFKRVSSPPLRRWSFWTFRGCVGKVRVVSARGLCFVKQPSGHPSRLCPDPRAVHSSLTI